MKLAIERNFPAALALAATFTWWYCGPTFPKEVKEFLAAALGLGAILTGFVATAKAILVALPSDRLMGSLRRSGYINDLVLYLAQALYGCLLFSIFCLVGFFLIATDARDSLPKWYEITWIGLGVFATAAFYRVSRLLFVLLKLGSDSKE